MYLVLISQLKLFLFQHNKIISMQGFWRMIEAVVAGMFLISFVLIITNGNYLLREPIKDLDSKAYHILKQLDERGTLRSNVITLNYTGINSQISFYGFNHSVEICDHSGRCVGERPSQKANVWVGNYFIAGDENYDPYNVKLYLWW